MFHVCFIQSSKQKLFTCKQTSNGWNESIYESTAAGFPQYANEKTNNRYGIGDWLEVCMRKQRVTATVIDKEN